MDHFETIRKALYEYVEYRGEHYTADTVVNALTSLDSLKAEYERMRVWMESATAFQFSGKAPNMACRVDDLPIRIEARDQRDGSRKWAVMQGGNCLRKDGDWELEMQPSSRTDEWLKLTRWDSREEARAAIDAALGEADLTIPAPAPAEKQDEGAATGRKE